MRHHLPTMASRPPNRNPIAILLVISCTGTGCIGGKLGGDSGWDSGGIISGGAGSDDSERVGTTAAVCRGWDDTTGSHLGYGGYPDSTASSGPECACEARGGDFEEGSYYVTGATFHGTELEPYRLGLKTPLGTEKGRNPTSSGSDWEHVMRGFSSGSAYTLDSRSWQGWLSKKDKDGTRVSCDDYPEPVFSVEVNGSPPMSPPPPMAGEEERECRPGEKVRSRFVLRYAPFARPDHLGLMEAVALYAGGDRAYRGVSIDRVRILDRAKADVIGLYGVSERLLQGSEVELKPGAWMGSAIFTLPPSSELLGGPTIEIEGTCPMKRPEPLVRGPAWVLDDLPSMLGAPAGEVLVRLVPDGSDRAIRHIMFEVPGSSWARGVEARIQPDGSWRFEHEGRSGLVLMGGLRIEGDAAELEIDKARLGELDLGLGSFHLVPAR